MTIYNCNSTLHAHRSQMHSLSAELKQYRNKHALQNDAA